MRRKVISVIVSVLFLCAATYYTYLILPLRIVSEHRYVPETVSRLDIYRALYEYTNRRLYLYPDRALFFTDNARKPELFKALLLDIRQYSSESYQDSIFLWERVSSSLVKVNVGNKGIYCNGIGRFSDYGYPNATDSFSRIGKVIYALLPPSKPSISNTNEHKNIIDMINEKILRACADFSSGDLQAKREWRDCNIYVSNFYDYDAGTDIWIQKKDGSIAYITAYITFTDDLRYIELSTPVNYINEENILDKETYEYAIQYPASHIVFSD